MFVRETRPSTPAIDSKPFDVAIPFPFPLLIRSKQSRVEPHIKHFLIFFSPSVLLMKNSRGNSLKKMKFVNGKRLRSCCTRGRSDQRPARRGKLVGYTRGRRVVGTLGEYNFDPFEWLSQVKKKNLMKSLEKAVFIEEKNRFQSARWKMEDSVLTLISAKSGSQSNFSRFFLFRHPWWIPRLFFLLSSDGCGWTAFLAFGA
jgi:hypothetical protein